MKLMQVSEARQFFAQALAYVGNEEDFVVVVRYGQPVAALVSLGRLTPGERKELSALLALDEGTRKGPG